MILDEGPPSSSRLIGEVLWIAGRVEKVINRFVEAARAAGTRAFAYVGGVTPASRLEGPGTVVFLDMHELLELLGEDRRGRPISIP